MCVDGCKQAKTVANVPFRNTVGFLMYLMVGKRFILAAAVGVHSQLSEDPCPIHWQTFNRVFRSFKARRDMKLSIKQQAMKNWTDTRMQNGPETRKIDKAQAIMRSYWKTGA